MMLEYVSPHKQVPIKEWKNVKVAKTLDEHNNKRVRKYQNM